ncbi:MAG TPA: DUF488 domain-containing protein, partial [Flavipsychrobacter sp.]|nr:DUF488 domain-containing protein [Flavipsychrobacter sp.]
SLLKSFEIQLLADIRTLPGSNRFPHFNKPALEQSLHTAGIDYIHIPDLGGRRRPRPDSKNTVWRNKAFQGYADYMETDTFKNAIEQLGRLAQAKRTAYMCSEAVWWRCHRSLVSDYLKVHGWTVMHIMDKGKSTEHPYTSPARLVQGDLFYNEE